MLRRGARRGRVEARAEKGSRVRLCYWVCFACLRIECTSDLVTRVEHTHEAGVANLQPCHSEAEARQVKRSFRERRA